MKLSVCCVVGQVRRVPCEGIYITFKPNNPTISFPDMNADN